MNNTNGLSLARMLGMAGAAISPKDSWQQRLGAASAEMAKQEQGRRYLAELLSGQVAKDIVKASDEEEEESAKEDGEEGGSSELTKKLSDALAPRYMDLSRYPYLDRKIKEEDITPSGKTIRRNK